MSNTATPPISGFVTKEFGRRAQQEVCPELLPAP